MEAVQGLDSVHDSGADSSLLKTITPTSRIRLKKLLIQKSDADHYRVALWGGDSKIVTRQLGITCLQLLRTDGTLHSLQESLQAKTGSGHVSAYPLLKALHSAGMIASIDKRRVASNRPRTLGTVVRFLGRFYLSPALRWVLLRLSGKRITPFFLRLLTERELRRQLQEDVNLAQHNYMSAYPSSEQQAPRFEASEYRSNLVDNVVATSLPLYMSPLALRKWLTLAFFSETEQVLRTTQQAGRGTILAVYHFGLPRLMPYFLSSLGFDCTLIAPPLESWGVEKTRNLLSAFGSLPGHGSIEYIPGFSLSHLKQARSALQANRILVCAADVFNVGTLSPAPSQNREAFEFFRTEDASNNGVVCVRLGQLRFHLGSWIGWLASKTKAPVVPVTMLRDHSKRVDARFLPVIAESVVTLNADRPDADAINQELYRSFRTSLESFPSQYFPWRILHHFSPHDDRSSCRIQNQVT